MELDDILAQLPRERSNHDTSRKIPIWKRFWEKVNRNGKRVPYMPTNCWEWTAGSGGRVCAGVRYGAFTVSRHARPQSMRAHRFSWLLDGREIPNGLLVLHKCDNPRCVRPDHLFVGTTADNVMDKIRKGRQPEGDNHYFRKFPERHARGERVNTAKLTAESVVEIRRLKKLGAKKPAIARVFGISVSTIKDIVKARTWRHVA